MDVGEHEPRRAEAEERSGGERGLGRFLAGHRKEILAAWADEARRLPTAAHYELPVLYDAAPAILDSLARTLTGGRVEDEATAHHLIEEHALQRLEHGYSLSQATSEYAILRDVILRLWNLDPDYPSSMDELRTFHRTIDKAIEMGISYFTAAQRRAHAALDRIAVASLESRDLDELLHRLEHAVLESLPAVDTVAILLREGDVLRVRVAEGLGREAEAGFTVPIGEGFAGTIAATKKAVLLKTPSDGPLLRSPHLRERHLLALYGVPLVADGEVIGVAHIGSLTATEFDEQDLRILDALAARATAAIYQQLLRREADDRAAQLSAVFESVPDALIIADRKGVVRSNRRAGEMLGIPVEELVREPHRRRIERLHALDVATGEPIRRSGFAQAFEGKTTSYEVSIRLPDGQERILRISTAPVRHDGSIDQAVAVGIDVTEGKRFERERAELLEREQDARRRAEQAVHLREQVLAIVSHDLRNPLGAVRTSADLILRRARELHERRIFRHAETIRRSVSRMDHLIVDLLDAATIESGGLSVEARRERAGSLLREAVQLQEPLAAEKNVRIVGDDQAGSAMVDVDRDRMLQVFANLIGNALKYSDPGGAITVRARASGEQVRFEVADDGPGLSEDEVAHIFEPFWTRAKKGRRGTGLGLVIAKGIVEAHHGRIRADSRPGKGTTFCITLPAAVAPIEGP